MRGKHLHTKALGEKGGLIPAYAGKTFDEDLGEKNGTAHPRVCGENVPQSLNDKLTAGSSPRMRGKPFVPPIVVSSTGLIPAYAGKTRKDKLNCV